MLSGGLWFALALTYYTLTEKHPALRIGTGNLKLLIAIAALTGVWPTGSILGWALLWMISYMLAHWIAQGVARYRLRLVLRCLASRGRASSPFYVSELGAGSLLAGTVIKLLLAGPMRIGSW